MYLMRSTLVALVGVVSASPIAAQGIPRNARQQTVTNAPRLMVANPFAFAPADSANAVKIGSAARAEMKAIVGRNFTVVEQTQMNDALKQYGYPTDAILTPQLAVTLAKNIQARVVLTGSMARAGGRMSVTARLIGVNDEAGNVVSLTQASGQSVEDFGKKLARALEPAVKALPDAKACVDQQTSKPDKAQDAANKAIRTRPNHGLAEFCLAQIAKAQKKPAEVVKHLQAAVKGDPLSLSAWNSLAEHYQAANDTANTLIAFKQMLRVAPTNQTMRERLFKYFLASGHPETAREVADEGLKIDPFNADLYDLKSNACLFLSDFKCAVDALETMYATDSTKADSLFFTKISVAAQEGKDAQRMVKWSQIGTKKYPTNRSLLGYLNAAYALSGQPDSVISVTSRIIAVDSSEAAVEAALAAAKVLIVAPEQATTDTSPPGTAPGTASKPTGSDNAPAAAARRDTVKATPASFTPRPKDALPFLEFAIKHGDAQRKEQAAALLYGGAAPLLQEPQDLEGAAELLRLAVQTANPSGKVHPAANYLLGLALLFQVPKIDPLAEKQKSCELARQEETLLLGADSALTAGRSASPEAVDKNLGIIKKYKPRIASMLKAYCKGK
jgi:tetratricopeptide (TPR) repeat protein